jgi:signal transduction histidine kinase
VPRPPRHRLRAVARQAAWTVVAGGVVGLIIALSQGRTAVADIALLSAVSTTYAAAIGIPASLVMPRLAPRLGDMARPRAAVTVAAVMVGLAVAGSLAAGVVFVAAGLIDWSHYWRQFQGGVEIALVITAIGTLGALSVGTLYARLDDARRALEEQRLAKLRAEGLAEKARLAALEARLHPHFLFNTLNTIAALIPEAPARAEEIVGRLATLLRFALDSHGGGLVPLSQELRVVRDYLAIESARFGDRLRFAVEVPDGIEAAPVPPFCLQTLVENAIVHVAARRSEPTTVRVAGSRTGDGVRLEVTDDGPGFVGEPPPGRGLDNLRRRLAAQFGPDAQLAIEPADPGTAVVVTVPLSQTEAA